MPQCCIGCEKRFRACQDTCTEDEMIQFREKIKKKRQKSEESRMIGDVIIDARHRMHTRRGKK